MDRFSAGLANALLGKDLHAPVLEMHFPSMRIRFEEPTVICITGGDFTPTIDGVPIPVNHPVAVNKNTVLKCERMISGARAYLAVLHDFVVPLWKHSFSTNMKAGAGGWHGRPLIADDMLPLSGRWNVDALLRNGPFHVLPWKAADTVENRVNIEFLIGSEWHWLTDEAKENFLESPYQLSYNADRMGYRLTGKELELQQQEQLVSSAVSFGTIQLLPNGQLIILMADHQTTGGYPRIAYVITAHLPILAQKRTNDLIRFVKTDLHTAEQKMVKQQKYLQQLQNACKFRMENFVHATL
jgi:antagonist of KipI